MPLEMDSMSGVDAVCQFSTGLSGSYVHVIPTGKLHIPALFPSIIMPCWPDTDRTTKKKALWCKSSIKRNCHKEPPQNASLYQRYLSCIPSVIKLGTNLNLLVLNLLICFPSAIFYYKKVIFLFPCLQTFAV